VKRGDLIRINTRLDEGVNVNEQAGPRGFTALILASSGNLETVQLLLRRKANPNVADFSGFTALMHAALCGLIGTCRVLLEAGADPSAANNAGKTAAKYAKHHHIGALNKLLRDWVRADTAIASSDHSEQLTSKQEQESLQLEHSVSQFLASTNEDKQCPQCLQDFGVSFKFTPVNSRSAVHCSLGCRVKWLAIKP